MPPGLGGEGWLVRPWCSSRGVLCVLVAAADALAAEAAVAGGEQQNDWPDLTLPLRRLSDWDESRRV